MRPTDLTKYFHKLSVEDLQKIPDIGPTVAQSIFNWFRDEHNIKLLEKLQRACIVLEAPKISARNQKLSGKIIVLTGELESLTRDDAKDRIRELGGDVSSSVSQNTDFVVVGENPGSKYDKAKKLGVKMIGEKEFLKMIKTHGTNG
jgi:DNA ligase (NAD+)